MARFVVSARRMDVRPIDAREEQGVTEVTDLVGLRIITYYREDVTRVGEILKKEFQIDATNSVDKAAALDPDRFGYPNAA